MNGYRQTEGQRRGRDPNESTQASVAERHSLELRPATVGDADAIVEISTGPIEGKRRFIVESLTQRSVVIAAQAADIAGYIIWDRAFFGRPFVWLLGVAPGFRRRGIAMRLMRAFESAHPGESLFTSTNESNLPMQSMLERLGFVYSGRVENLDPGDPEWFYFKAGVDAQQIRLPNDPG